MNSRNRRRSRQANMKARVGIATAVVVGGGAVGVAAVAANGGGASTTASSAGYIMRIQHHIPASQALSGALSTWGKTNASHQRALGILAQMNPMRNYNQVWGPRHTRFAHTQYAAQRGMVLGAGTVKGKQFLVVRSANGATRVWWLTGKTGFVNATSSANAMVAMTGNNNAAAQAMVNNNTTAAANQMAGGTANVAKAAAGGFSFTGTFTINGQTFTITITSTGQGQITPTTPPASPSSMPPTSMAPTSMPPTSMAPTSMPPTSMAPTSMPPTSMAPTSMPPTSMAPTSMAATSMPPTSMAATPTAPATMPASLKTLVKGDLVFVVGVRSHGQLTAQIVVLLKTAAAVTPTAPPTTPGNTAPVAPTSPAVTGGSSGTHF